MVVPPVSRKLSLTEQQAIRARHGLPVPARRGFSIIELLIVVSILTVVTAFVIPAVKGPLERSRLRSAAVDVQNAWGKARSLAIREGMPMVFRCELGGQYWKIERVGHTVAVSSNTDAEETPSGLRVDSKQNDGLGSEHRPASRLVREGWLPQGVTFDELKLRGQTESASDQLGNSDKDLSQSMVFDSRWSDALEFRPEGRSHDAVLRVAGSDDSAVNVRIRGLTSSVTFTAPFQRTPPQQQIGGGL